MKWNVNIIIGLSWEPLSLLIIIIIKSLSLYYSMSWLNISLSPLALHSYFLCCCSCFFFLATFHNNAVAGCSSFNPCRVLHSVIYRCQRLCYVRLSSSTLWQGTTQQQSSSIQFTLFLITCQPHPLGWVLLYHSSTIYYCTYIVQIYYLLKCILTGTRICGGGGVGGRGIY